MNRTYCHEWTFICIVPSMSGCQSMQRLRLRLLMALLMVHLSQLHLRGGGASLDVPVG